MKINIRLSSLKGSRYANDDWSLKRKIEYADELVETGRDPKAFDSTVTIEISNLGPKRLQDLYEDLGKRKKEFEIAKTPDPILNTMINKINKFLSIINDPNSVKITTIEQFKTAITEAVKKSKNKWLFILGKDERILPWCVESIEEKSSREEGSYYRYIRIELKASVSPFIKENTRYEKTINIDKDDLEEPMSLEKILDLKGIYLEDEISVKEYKQSLDRFLSLYRKSDQGTVFTTEDRGSVLDEKNDSWYSYYEKWEYLSNSSTKHRLVVDFGDNQQKVDNSSFLNSGKPVHPYLKVFNLFDHRYYKVHCDNLDEYVYDQTISEKLVIDDFNKKLIISLITNKTVSEDVIQGKSGGSIIMAYGPPGVGKTLTAEVMSEILEKPLYKVQASQLGISPEKIEQNIQTILRRSERINAILLIDEADTYIRKRDTDIVQNNIVGAFLRVMEYFKGIMFLTTNLKDTVDQAILSRCLLKIKYEYLDNKATEKVFRIQEEFLKMPLTTNDEIRYFYASINGEAQKQNVESILSGRYIKNMLKVYCLIYPDQPFINQNFLKIKSFI